MKETRLKSRIRDGFGKRMAHKLRAGGEVPAVLYGHKQEPMSLAVAEHELWTILHNATSEHMILLLEIEGGDEREVLTLVRDVQHQPITGDIVHLDLQRISANEQIKVGVPVELIGIARGVKEFGGVLDHGVREVTVRCKPNEIPESLEIDISALEIGDSVHISDIKDRYGQIEFLDDLNVTLAHVSPPKKLEVSEEAEAEEAAEGAEAEEAAAEGEAETPETETP
jgi:large subunit ribosomal protein L25